MKKMKKNIVTMILVFALVLSGCSNNSTANTETSQEIKISEDTKEKETSKKVYKKIKVSTNGKASKVSKVSKDMQAIEDGNWVYKRSSIPVG